MDWIAIGTLSASIVAAVGAVWAVVVSHRQLTFARQSAEMPLPTVEAELLGEVSDVPGWSLIRVEIRNRAPIAADAISVRMVEPHGLELIRDYDVYRTDPEIPWEPEIKDPLPSAVEILPLNAFIDRAGGTKHGGGAADWTFIDLYVHCPPSRFEGVEPRLILEMRWRDHTTKTFAMAVNVIKPSTA